ncbi:sce7726 family protein [Acinetobacter sp. NIPH 2699]|uniref:sce7726 family protein n=1 Tax=Acinetobacter sp. NIPH 2699 TaxID=2923433 RepID=UPI001F4C1D08|nr:sce7726 family protein [Acinetobacter sp. NIPH 2699]MCH7337815.1 sce7726 family protein [Acinetobacter sp. NIPH 2699]
MKWQNKAIAKIFNSNVLNSIARGDFSYLEKLQEQKNYDINGLNLSDFYQQAYTYLSKNYQNEYFYKSLIIKKILLGRHSLNTATMLSEFRVGLRKADCVILNGKSTCYEIKTNYDSLIRLEDQLDSYLQLFDEVYVVCSTAHLQSVVDITSPCVGILVLNEFNRFTQIRKAIKRTQLLNRGLLMQSLRQEEYKKLAEILINDKINLPNTLLYKECLDIVEKYADEKFLNIKFIEILKKSRKNNDKLIKSLPDSLANAAISYRFGKKETDNLIEYFKKEVPIHVLSDSKREIE